MDMTGYKHVTNNPISSYIGAVSVPLIKSDRKLETVVWLFLQDGCDHPVLRSSSRDHTGEMLP